MIQIETNVTLYCSEKGELFIHKVEGFTEIPAGTQFTVIDVTIERFYGVQTKTFLCENAEPYVFDWILADYICEKY